MKTRRWLTLLAPWLLIIVIGLLALWLQLAFIVPPSMEHQCDGGRGPAWCGLRQFLVTQAFVTYGFGYLALAATLLALIWRRQVTAWLAAALGILALEMFCYEGGAVALLIGCLLLVRLQANRAAAPGEQHRHAQQQIQSQP